MSFPALDLFQVFWVLPAVLLVVFAGSVVQAGLGMGFGITAAPVLALIDPVLVPVPAIYIATGTALVGAWTERDRIVWKEVNVGMAGRLFGIVVGTFVLARMVDLSVFSLVFGIIIMFAVLLSVIGWQLELTARNLLAMGTVSGFTGIITSVGAPPLALIYQHRPAETCRATLSSFFAIGGAVSLVILYASGLANLSHFWLALIMAPAAIAGTWVGGIVRGRFDRRYRVFLLAIAAVASLLLIARGLS